MLYRITDGTLAIGGENLLEHFDFEIKGRERIAITGPNGSGVLDKILFNASKPP